jgi:phosphoribosylformimino-5-aminoimidazole carboxamide ribotide isomerase
MFRPCIDLHEGRVKQIVGSTLESGTQGLITHFVSEKPATWYAELFKRDGLRGGHVIMLGPGNEEAARAALAVYPGGLQVGGGINSNNAKAWLDAGASHVIVSSWVFHGGQIDWDRLRILAQIVGKERLVLDLSCKKVGDQYLVACDRWKTLTQIEICPSTLEELANWCDEFLVHAIDREGKLTGVDLELVEKLADWSPIAVTYAGGARSIQDLYDVTRVSKGRVDLTIGSALDIFGGTGVRYSDAVEFNRRFGKRAS